MRHTVDWYYELSRAYTHRDAYIYLKRRLPARYRFARARKHYIGIGRPRPEQDIHALYTLEEEVLHAC